MAQDQPSEIGMDIPEDQAPHRGPSGWAYAVRYQFTRSDRQVLATIPMSDMTLEVQQGSQSVWVVTRWANGGGVALRTSFSPEEGLSVCDCTTETYSVECRTTAPSGDYRVRVEVPDQDKCLLHFTVWLTPAGELSVPFWPSDTYPIDERGDPLQTDGTVHAAQRGLAAGIVFASLTKPKSGSFLYFQNLTALNDYCEQTHTSPDTRVGGSWPELGYSVPSAERVSLKGGREVVISDAYVHFTPQIPQDTGELGRLFFSLFSEIYLQIPRPAATYRDWPALAEQTIRDLESDQCIEEHKGLRYLAAYVGTGSRRPESLVQLAVALPLIEYGKWRGEEVKLVDGLMKTLDSFYYDDVRCLMRYPHALKSVDGEHADEKGAYEVDSWYLYHPLSNLARLALYGYDNARHLLMKSIDYAINAAHHFECRWPILFDARNFEVIREPEQRELGETDIAGLYAYLMLQMLELTGDEKYLQEAIQSAERLKGLHFSTGYQFNNTAWAANALARLWLKTINEDYRDLSLMCAASIFQNCFLWDCNYGFARHYSTFMGITPLREGPYLAAYEEMEVFSAFHEYLSILSEQVMPAALTLITEYCKYMADNLFCAFPSRLPKGAICDKPKNGHINTDLAIPLEDLYQGWEKAGQVGQEIYGAGVAPALAVRCVHKPDGAPFRVFCQYPIQQIRVAEEKKRCVVSVRGDPRLACVLRVLPSEGKTLDRLEAAVKGAGSSLRPQQTSDGHLDYTIPGGSVITIGW